MAAMTIRNLDDEVRDALRVQAAERGRSMEAEVRAILTAAVAGRRQSRNALMDLYWASRDDVEFDLPPREAARDAIDFSGAEFG